MRRAAIWTWTVVLTASACGGRVEGAAGISIPAEPRADASAEVHDAIADHSPPVTDAVSDPANEMVGDPAIDPHSDPSIEESGSDCQTKPPECSPGAWIVEQVEEMVPSTGFDHADSSVRVDPAGVVHVAYTVRSLLRYGTNACGAWKLSTLQDCVDCWGASLALDGQGSPHLTFTDNHNSVQYGSLQLGAWAFETAAVETDGGWTTSLALDPQGNPHVTYYDQKILHHAERVAGSWEATEIDPHGFDRGSSLAIGGDGTVHVSYYAMQLGYARRTSGVWTHAILSSGGLDSSIVLDGDSPILSHADNPSGAGAVIVRWADGTTEPFQPGFSTRLARSADSSLHLIFEASYADAGYGEVAVLYATNRTGSWVVETAGKEASIWSHPDIAVGPDGAAHVVYSTMHAKVMHAVRCPG